MSKTHLKKCRLCRVFRFPGQSWSVPAPSAVLSPIRGCNPTRHCKIYRRPWFPCCTPNSRFRIQQPSLVRLGLPTISHNYDWYWVMLSEPWSAGIYGSLGRQTSDNVENWNRRGGKSQKKRVLKGRRKIKSEARRCRCLKKSKSSETLRFFQRFVAEEGVARSRFGNQKMESTSRPEHCGRMSKSARRCGAKRVWKYITLNLVSVAEHFWNLTYSKKCLLLWREAHLEVKMGKAHRLWSTFGSWDWHVQTLHAVVPGSALKPRFDIKICKAHHVRSTFITFGRWDVQKVHAIVAWNAFRNQKC